MRQFVGYFSRVDSIPFWLVFAWISCKNHTFPAQDLIPALSLFTPCDWVFVYMGWDIYLNLVGFNTSFFGNWLLQCLSYFVRNSIVWNAEGLNGAELYKFRLLVWKPPVLVFEIAFCSIVQRLFWSWDEFWEAEFFICRGKWATRCWKDIAGWRYWDQQGMFCYDFDSCISN